MGKSLLWNRALLALASVWLPVAIAGLQEPLTYTPHRSQASWDTLSTTGFSSFAHPGVPDAALRIKKHDDFCDPTVRSYTGYLDVAHGTQHIFFYYFESRNDPQTDPVVLWLNGGPGCSSATGLFMELGPCRASMDGNSTSFNKYSWNERANLIFVDQPVGVGYSYSDFGIKVETTEEAAPIMQKFVSLFFETFSELRGRAFHIAGESYGGRYIPVFAAAILDHNAKLNSVAPKTSDLALAPINLTSIAIGNGMTNPIEMVATWYEIICTSASLPPVLSIAECVDIKRKLPLCIKRSREDCEETHDEIACGVALDFCFSITREPMLNSGLNPYDLSKKCAGSFDAESCYGIQPAIEKYLNLPSIRSKLGIPDTFPPFAGCSHSVGGAFNQRADLQVTSEHHLAQLLERGIKVLLYDGVLDMLCNKIGYLRLAESLEWSGQTEFIAQKMKPWTAGPDAPVAAGQTKTTRAKNGSGGLLTWAEIDGAGHMVPYDKPLESLVMINRWLAGIDLESSL